MQDHSVARHSGNGKNTVEGCRSIDVLEWHRLGHLQLPGWFSCAWASDSECVASIDVQAQRHFVALKYRSRSCNHNWSDPVQRIPIAWTTCRFGGERPWFVCPVTSEGMYCGRSVNNLYGAGRLFACRHCYQLAYASQREPAHLRGLKNHKRSECGWVEARTCLTIFRRNPRACTGGRMRDGVACTIWPNSDRPSA